MDYNAGAAIGAGLTGALATIIVLYVWRAILPEKMNLDLLHMLGTMAVRNRVGAYAVGVLAALVYTTVFQAAKLESNLLFWGALFGFVHFWVVSRGMGVMGTIHPMMRSGEMQDPGSFLEHHPPMTRMGFFVLHLLFGLLVGLLYGMWA